MQSARPGKGRSRSRRRLWMQASLRCGCEIPALDSPPNSSPIHSCRFPRPKKKGSASASRCAGPLSRLTAAAFGWMSTHPAPTFISPCPSPSRLSPSRLSPSRPSSWDGRPMAESLHVALVDDDLAVLDSLQLYFARQDVKASCFASAEALLAALDGGAQPDCIVSDVRMPGMSGLDLFRRLNNRRSSAPIILMTGVGDIEMAVSAIKSGAYDFIEKPFDEGRLLASIQSAVAIGRQRADDAAEIEKLRSRFKMLSARQRQVMELAVS